MEQFVVPQFIDVEDKIVGPITTRQFVIVLAGGLLSFIIYKLLTFGFYVVIQIIILAMIATLGFIKINGQPFHFFLLNLIQTLKRPSLRIWGKEVDIELIKAGLGQEKEPSPPPTLPKKELPSVSKLAELSLIVNTGGAYQGENNE